ncbi:MAG: AI-2E family transporter [Alphaproteobacteria bacterium]|nr:AI-2E family transporter [Alphaproteobacteria bacterium]
MNGREVAAWIVGSAALLGLMVVGQPLLVPLVFALLLWAVVNAMVEALTAFRVPRWAAFGGAVLLLVLTIWLILQIVGNQASGLAVAIPTYSRRLTDIAVRLLTPLKIHLNPKDFFSTADVTSFLTTAAASIGTSLLAVIQVLVYMGFLLSEQHQMADKVARLQKDAARHNEIREIVAAIARQIQSYLGVCTVLSAIMAGATFALLTILGVQFAAFWAVIVFLLTYVPTIGAIGVIFPALMALVQFGTFGAPIIILVVLGGLHFVLLNVAETLILGQTLNLSPFAIILALTFWGLVWGVAGLFLAVPVTGAIAIVCNHIPHLRWIAILLGAPRRTKPKRAPAH